MISVKTQYETHDGEFLAIVEVFKTSCHYLKSCNYEVFDFTDHNNLYRYIDSEILSSKQVCLAQKLSWYYFWIDYHRSKANGATDVLSKYSQRNAKEEATIKAKNTKILHRLQTSLAKVSELSAHNISSLY